MSSARYASASRADARALLARSAGWVLAVSTALALALAAVGRPVIELLSGLVRRVGRSAVDSPARCRRLHADRRGPTWYFNAHVRKPLVNLVIAGFSALLNASLTLWWAPAYGLTGVAWATTVAYISASILSLVIVHRQSSRSS